MVEINKTAEQQLRVPWLRTSSSEPMPRVGEGTSGLMAKLVSIEQACATLGVCRSTIYRMLRNHRLSGLKYSHSWRIHIPVCQPAPCVA